MQIDANVEENDLQASRELKDVIDVVELAEKENFRKEGNPYYRAYRGLARVLLLRKLLQLRGFTPGTKEEIVNQLDGSHPSHTCVFVERLIDLSCLVFKDVAKVKGRGGIIERPIYDRDIDKLREVWMHTLEFRFSFEILDEEAVIWTSNLRLL